MMWPGRKRGGSKTFAWETLVPMIPIWLIYDIERNAFYNKALTIWIYWMYWANFEMLKNKWLTAWESSINNTDCRDRNLCSQVCRSLMKFENLFVRSLALPHAIPSESSMERTQIWFVCVCLRSRVCSCYFTINIFLTQVLSMSVFSSLTMSMVHATCKASQTPTQGTVCNQGSENCFWRRVKERERAKTEHSFFISLATSLPVVINKSST